MESPQFHQHFNEITFFITFKNIVFLEGWQPIHLFRSFEAKITHDQNLIEISADFVKIVILYIFPIPTTLKF